MLSGHFHDSRNKFKQDDFFDEVSPIVYSITGPPEDCSDEELPHQCLIMAKDIMKKKKQYNDRKLKEAEEAAAAAAENSAVNSAEPPSKPKPPSRKRGRSKSKPPSKS